jgi:hypothetical protein
MRAGTAVGSLFLALQKTSFCASPHRLSVWPSSQYVRPCAAL